MRASHYVKIKQQQNELGAKDELIQQQQNELGVKDELIQQQQNAIQTLELQMQVSLEHSLQRMLHCTDCYLQESQLKEIRLKQQLQRKDAEISRYIKPTDLSRFDTIHSSIYSQ